MIREIKARMTIRDCFYHFGVGLPDRRNPVIRCCFHDEKTPSMKLYEDRGRFHCYGCQARGDVIDAAELFMNTDTAGAVKHFSQHLGLEGQAPVPSQQITEAQQLQRLRQHVKRRSIEVERFDVPKTEFMESYLVLVFGQKEEVDQSYRHAETKMELLQYLGELERWHEWAHGILRGAWSYWTERSMEVLATNLADTQAG
jgi:hypothetical protein